MIHTNTTLPILDQLFTVFLHQASFINVKERRRRFLSGILADNTMENYRETFLLQHLSILKTSDYHRVTTSLEFRVIESVIRILKNGRVRTEVFDKLDDSAFPQKHC